MKALKLLILLLTLLWKDGDGDGDGDGDDDGGDDGDSGGGGDGGGDGDGRSLRERQLEALVRNGITVPPGTEDVDAWIDENIAWTGNGTPLLTGEVDADGKPDGKPAKNTSKKNDGDKMTETQKAVKNGDPKLPKHVHRAIMSPSASRALAEDFDESRLQDSDYREALVKELGEVPMKEMREALMDRTEALWDSGEFNGVREQPLSGDLLRV